MRYGMAAILEVQKIANKLSNFKPLLGVYGNIDGQDIRSEFPEQLIFNCEDVKVMMKHIGGYPKRICAWRERCDAKRETAVIYFRSFAYFKDYV